MSKYAATCSSTIHFQCVGNFLVGTCNTKSLKVTQKHTHTNRPKQWWWLIIWVAWHLYFKGTRMLNFCKSKVMIPAPLEDRLQMQGGEDLKSDHYHYHQTPLCQFIKTISAFLFRKYKIYQTTLCYHRHTGLYKSHLRTQFYDETQVSPYVCFHFQENMTIQTDKCSIYSCSI